MVVILGRKNQYNLVEGKHVDIVERNQTHRQIELKYPSLLMCRPFC